MDRIHYNLSQYENVTVSGVVLNTDDLSSSLRHLITGKTGWTIYIQSIFLAVTTDHAATQLFQDTASSPIIAAGTKASPGIGPIPFPFGAEGFALTEAKGLDLKNSGAGLAYSYTVQAYRKKTASI